MKFLRALGLVMAIVPWGLFFGWRGLVVQEIGLVLLISLLVALFIVNKRM